MPLGAATLFECVLLGDFLGTPSRMRLDQVLKLLDQLSPEERSALLKLKMSDLLAEARKNYEGVEPGESVAPEKILERLRTRAAQLQSESQ